MARKTIQEYQKKLAKIDKNRSDEYTSMLILAILEEIGEMARAYLAKQGRKPTNVRAQQDESYKQELGDILVAILTLANIKNIDLDQQIQYTLKKITRRVKEKKKTLIENLIDH